MKLLFELRALEKSDFTWLNNERNLLFIIEDGAKLRILSPDDKPGNEYRTTTLAGQRGCSIFCWNKDGSRLALVVERHRVYFWDIEFNEFIRFKSNDRNTGNSIGAKLNTKDVTSLIWSKVSNKLALCYSNGQILLCNFDLDYSERLVGNSDGVLGKIYHTESSRDVDLFVCLSDMSELLVLSFDGDIKFYARMENMEIADPKFSSPWLDTEMAINERGSSTRLSTNIWLAYRIEHEGLYIKLIELASDFKRPTESQADVVYVNKVSGVLIDVVDFHWIHSSLLICCSSGQLIHVNLKPSVRSCGQASKFEAVVTEVLTMMPDVGGPPIGCLTQFDLVAHDSIVGQGTDGSVGINRCFSLASRTDHKVYYHELFWLDSPPCCKLEKVDELDLTGSLERMHLAVKKLKWSPDCSMLAVQLTNGQMLVYRTKLQKHLVTSHGSMSAYLSEPHKVTILEFGSQPSSVDNHASAVSEPESGPLSIDVGFKPSVIAIGPRHLAVALNNLVRIYSLDLQDVVEPETDRAMVADEQEYVSIVEGMFLCSSFAAIHFNDGRLKLHSIPADAPDLLSKFTSALPSDDVALGDVSDERFFPDPAKDEKICAFTLTEQLFVYCTYELYLHLFSLRNWTIVQTCHLGGTVDRPVMKLVANQAGNKLVCITRDIELSAESNVHLYDVRTNEIVGFQEETLYRQMVESMKLSLGLGEAGFAPDTMGTQARMTRVIDSLWDQDGRSVLLIERTCIHSSIVLDNTLERNGPLIEPVATAEKALSHRVLYSSNGVVSFQTSLGRVVNSILQSHEDEVKLLELEHRIRSIESEHEDPVGAQNAAMRLKMDYLHSVTLIHPLGRCWDICDHLANDSQFNPSPSRPSGELRSILWDQLAIRALYTMNLRFALMVYRKQRMLVRAGALSEIIESLDSGDIESKSSIKAKILLLIGCLNTT